MTNEAVEKRSVRTIVPSVNIVETPKTYIVTLDIPGAVKENIKANIEDNTLLVSAEVAEYDQNETADSAKQYRREFSLANDIDVHTVDARYELGVLTVTLNKKEQFFPKQIKIN